VKGAPRSLTNTKGLLPSLSRCKRRNARNSGPLSGWTLRRALLGPTDVQDGPIEVHLIPHGLGRSQAVPEGEQDHGRVPVPLPFSRAAAIRVSTHGR
jgi:hypothetical protein